MSLAAGASGFALGLALITPIGAQNAYVLRTAVRSSRAAIVTVLAMVIAIDVTLIALGALGAGAFLDGRDWLRGLLLLGGIALLAPLGVRTVREGVRGDVDYAALLATDAAATARSVVGPVLTLSLLNPHVYLDTVAILGSAIAATGADQRAAFTAGAMAASAVWFVFLGVLGSVVLRRFGAPVARAIDVISGVVMLVVASIFAAELGRMLGLG
jgi:L-lysine exporter family protein LysE/ArgO